MNLRSGRTFWPQISAAPAPKFPELDRDLNCDVAIIGAGISGALMAYHLTRAGVDCAILDRREAGQGSTAASTGLLQYEIDTQLVDLIAKLGKDRAVAAYRASVESIHAFPPLVEDLGDSCGLTPRQSLYLASEASDVEPFRAECEARRSMGIDVSYLSGGELRSAFDFSRPAALWSSLEFDVDPYRLTLQLIRRSVSRGARVHTATEIARCEPVENGMILHCANGPRVRARKVVFATGYETMEFLPSDLCRLASTFALVSQHLSGFPGWPQRCLIWESARPYLYLRTTEDNRAIVGGEDVDIVDPKERDRLMPQKTQTLVERFSKLMPKIQIEPECAWAGTFAQTKDGLPYIGAIRNLPSAYFALGYGGNGITFSLLAAQIITDLFLNRPNPYSDLFGFDR